MCQKLVLFCWCFHGAAESPGPGRHSHVTDRTMWASWCHHIHRASKEKHVWETCYHWGGCYHNTHLWSVCDSERRHQSMESFQESLPDSERMFVEWSVERIPNCPLFWLPAGEETSLQASLSVKSLNTQPDHDNKDHSCSLVKLWYILQCDYKTNAIWKYLKNGSWSLTHTVQMLASAILVSGGPVNKHSHHDFFPSSSGLSFCTSPPPPKKKEEKKKRKNAMHMINTVNPSVINKTSHITDIQGSQELPSSSMDLHSYSFQSSWLSPPTPLPIDHEWKISVPVVHLYHSGSLGFPWSKLKVCRSKWSIIT